MRESELSIEVRSRLLSWSMQYCGSAVAMGLLCAHLAYTAPAALIELSGWLVNRWAFFALFYLVMASAGATFASAGVQWRYGSSRTRKISDLLASLYAGTAGAVAGCALCACIGAAIEQPSRAWFPLWLAALVLFMTIAPLQCLLVARMTTTTLSDRWYAKAWRIFSTRGMGYGLVIAAMIGAWHDIVLYMPSA